MSALSLFLEVPGFAYLSSSASVVLVLEEDGQGSSKLVASSFSNSAMLLRILAMFRAAKVFPKH